MTTEGFNVDVKSFTGPAIEPTTHPQTENRHVRAVQHIADRKESDTPTPFSSKSSVSLEVRDHPLQLLLRVVKQKLDESLPRTGNQLNDIQLGNKQAAFKGTFDTELSPDLTAKYIITHAISFYEPYKLSHNNQNETEVFLEFVDKLTNIIQLGFDEAQEILQNLGVLHGEISRNIDSTFSLVQKNLVEFHQPTYIPPK